MDRIPSCFAFFHYVFHHNNITDVRPFGNMIKMSTNKMCPLSFPPTIYLVFLGNNNLKI